MVALWFTAATALEFAGNGMLPLQQHGKYGNFYYFDNYDMLFVTKTMHRNI